MEESDLLPKSLHGMKLVELTIRRPRESSDPEAQFEPITPDEHVLRGDQIYVYGEYEINGQKVTVVILLECSENKTLQVKAAAALEIEGNEVTKGDGVASDVVRTIESHVEEIADLMVIVLRFILFVIFKQGK
jgi:hypothetical protein